jgi:hypothetical protein
VRLRRLPRRWLSAARPAGRPALLLGVGGRAVACVLGGADKGLGVGAAPFDLFQCVRFCLLGAHQRGGDRGDDDA